MPIYEYQCSKCGYTTSEYESSNICIVIKKCPKCRNEMEKIISANTEKLPIIGGNVTNADIRIRL